MITGDCNCSESREDRGRYDAIYPQAGKYRAGRFLTLSLNNPHFSLLTDPNPVFTGVLSTEMSFYHETRFIDKSWKHLVKNPKSLDLTDA